MRIPIKVGVFESALRAVGGRALEIGMPTLVGAEVKFSSSTDVPLRWTSSIAARCDLSLHCEHALSLCHVTQTRRPLPGTT